MLSHHRQVAEKARRDFYKTWRALAPEVERANALFSLQEQFYQRLRNMPNPQQVMQAIYFRPDDVFMSPRLRTIQATALWKSGFQNRAIDVFETHVNLVPDDKKARMTLAVYYDHKRLYKQAEQHLLHIIRQDPEDYMAYNALAHIALEQEKSEEAEAYAERSCALNPTSTHAASLMARVEMQQGRHAEAEKRIRALVDLDPEDPVFRGLLAHALLNQKRFPEAAEEALRTMTMEPDSAYPHYMYAKALFMGGKQNESYVYLRRRLMECPDCTGPEIILFLAHKGMKEPLLPVIREHVRSRFGEDALERWFENSIKGIHSDSNQDVAQVMWRGYQNRIWDSPAYSAPVNRTAALQMSDLPAHIRKCMRRGMGLDL